MCFFLWVADVDVGVGPTTTALYWQPLGKDGDAYCESEEYDVENGSTEGTCEDYEEYDI